MVLFKRKPVQPVPRPALYEDQEIWIIEKTGEIFSSYDAYLSRMEFYKQRRFICEITGHSGLDFFAALEKELEASDGINHAFPDPLREPILRSVQHSTISRIDNLVDATFEDFKRDFYPGEDVQVVLEGHEKMPGIVREKTRFNETYDMEGQFLRPASVRYFVSLTDQPEHEAIVDNAHIVRDRRNFSKQMLRQFLKDSLHREAWLGAPWQVKAGLAQQYRISTEIPENLTYEAQVSQRRMMGTKKTQDFHGTIMNIMGVKPSLPELKPKGQKAKFTAQEADKMRDYQYGMYKKALSRNPSFGANGTPIGSPSNPTFVKFVSQNPSFPAFDPRTVAPKPPPPIKYPIEDLDLEVSDRVRPPIKFLTPHSPSSAVPGPVKPNEMAEETTAKLLETWNTLNVYCEVFELDSFTFDDYVEALSYPRTELPCELLTEVHCAILKKLVNGETDQNGRVHITLPEDEDSDEEDEESSTGPSPSPEPVIEARTTRGSLRKSDAALLKAQVEREAKIHNGAEVEQSVKGYGWKARLRKRDFLDGRWVVIIVGLLNAFTADPRRKKNCEAILASLAPPKMPATESTVINQYSEIDINKRADIIEFLCFLTLETRHIRDYMEECTTNMTQYRKDKMEWQKKRKAFLEDLKALDEERRKLQPEAKSPAIELEQLNEELIKAEAIEKGPDTEQEDEDITMEDVDDEDEGPKPARSLRRANDRAAERKRRQEEDRKKKEDAKIEKANKPTKEAKQLEKVMKKIEAVKEEIKDCEAEIAVCDGDLRESDCHRTRCLGVDRFWNRYWWFERNAMPFGGLPDSSTADADYANGCIWVQGPDEVERLGFIDMELAHENEYERAHGLTVRARKVKEEGETHVFGASQYGFYQDPEELDRLIAWLNEKGKREVKLRKQLNAYKDQIIQRMQNRMKYLEEADAQIDESPQHRSSARTKATQQTVQRRCWRWTNETARMENGHLHIEPQPTKRRGVAHRVEKPKGKSANPKDEGRQTRAGNKPTKMPTRQGTKYSF